MLCLEVTVNGKPYCIAGREDALVSAGLSRDVCASSRAPAMKVAAVSTGPAGFEHWGAEECFARLGDVVTVRVVEREAADSPAWQSTVTAPFRLAPSELFTHVSRGAEGELFLWVGLIVGTAAILLFG
jgi:hypothetical protein